MKIIKQGKSKEELKGILNKTMRFECKTCGCIFEADEGEYIEEDCFYSFSFYCKCPNCGMNAIEKHGKAEYEAKTSRRDEVLRLIGEGGDT